MRKRKIAGVLIATLMFAMIFVSSAFADVSEIIKGGDFESDEGNWYNYFWLSDDGSVSIDDTVFYNGTKSVHLSSKKDNDVRVIQNITVKPLTFYTVKAFVKTKDVKTTVTGATISVINETVKSESVSGTTDWRELTFSFITEKGRDTVELCFTLGGYGALNSGDVWFDDITITECSERPQHCHELMAKNDGSKETKKKNYAGYPINDYPDEAKWSLFAFVIIMLISVLGVMFAETDDITGDDKKAKKTFIFIMAAALVFRVMVAMFSKGFSFDIGCFRAWSWYASSDLFNMYSSSRGYFLDYPPLYMYMLAPVGALANAGDVIGEPLALFFLKLPALIADMVSAYLIYSFAKNKLGAKWALVLGAFYAFNPAVWLDSVAWGQVDSIFALFVIAEFIFIQKKKWWGVGIFFALSVLLKPHGIIFAPAIGMAAIMELFRNKKIAPLLVTVGTGVATVVVLLLPFYIRTGFENPKWILDLYIGTVDSYKYATLNGFNFWALLGFNAANVEKVFCGLTFSQWGMIAIVASCVMAVLFSVFGTRKKIKAGNATFIIVAMLVLVTIFTFAHKMHERYMFAAIALAVLAFIETKDRNYMYLALLFTVVIFLNVYEIYDLNIMWSYPYPAKDDILMNITSALEVLSFAYSFVCALRTLVFNKISKPFSLRDNTTNEVKE